MTKRTRQPAVEESTCDAGADLAAAHLSASFVDIEDMSVHQILKPPLAEGADELIVSTMKTFRLDVALRDAKRQRLGAARAGCARTLTATLLYENGHQVDEGPLGEPPMKGGEADVDDHGQAVFNLQIFPTSSQRQNQRFRVRVSAKHAPQVAAAITLPVRTKTKIRLPKEHRAEGARGWADQAAGASARRPPAETQAVAVAVVDEEAGEEAAIEDYVAPFAPEAFLVAAAPEAEAEHEWYRQDQEILTANSEGIRKLKEQDEEIRRELCAARRAISETFSEVDAASGGALRIHGA